MKIKKYIIVSVMVLLAFYKFSYPQTSGPIGGNVYSLAFSGSYVLAGTNGGVFKTSDNGNTWIQTSLYNHITRSICSNGSIVIAYISFGGMYYSNNNGTTWIQLPENISKVLNIASIDSNIFAGTMNGVSASSDNGQNWKQTSLNKGFTLVFTSNESVIFAATSKDENPRYGLYYSTNKGLDWIKIYNSNSQIASFAGFGTNIYAATESGGLLRSTDFGQSWSELDFTQRCFALSVFDSNIFAGTKSGLYVSSDKGESWECTLVNQTIHCIIANESIVLCGTEKNGVYLSTNNGMKWLQTSLINLEIHPDIFDKSQIPGKWEDFILPPLMAGNSIIIDFAADSFYYHNIRFSDVFEEPCSQYFGDEYASGKFEIKDSLIHFKGNWTDKTYKNILTEAPCNTGKFELIYCYKYYSNHMLSLDLINPVNLPKNSTGIKTKLYLYKK